MKRQYGLRYEGIIFHTCYDPPKLIQLGSGEILQWVNTRKIDGRYIAEYRDAEIEKYTYIHKSDLEATL